MSRWGESCIQTVIEWYINKINVLSFHILYLLSVAIICFQINKQDICNIHGCAKVKRKWWWKGSRNYLKDNCLFNKKLIVNRLIFFFYSFLINWKWLNFIYFRPNLYRIIKQSCKVPESHSQSIGSFGIIENKRLFYFYFILNWKRKMKAFFFYA